MQNNRLFLFLLENTQPSEQTVKFSTVDLAMVLGCQLGELHDLLTAMDYEHTQIGHLVYYKMSLSPELESRLQVKAQPTFYRSVRETL